MLEPVRARPDASGDRTPAIRFRGPPATSRNSHLRATRPHVRCLSLLAATLSIDATLSRLAQFSASLTEHGPFRVQVLADRLLILRRTPEIPTLAPVVAFEHHLRVDAAKDFGVDPLLYVPADGT